MNLPLWIARRYFVSKKKRSFISLISNISMLGVGVGTMALVVVLSVFNGMEDLNRQIFESFEADLKIMPVVGKRFEIGKINVSNIQKTAGVAFVTQVIEDNALARYGDAQMIVKLKGVDNTYLQRHQLDSAMIDGNLVLSQDGAPTALLADGVQAVLGVSLEDPFTALELWYPRNSRTFSVTPNAFNQLPIRPAGFFSLSANQSEYVIAPLNFVSQLLDYQTQRTALEVQLKPNADTETVQEAIQAQLGKAFLVQTRDELNADLFRAIKIEKLFVGITLSFIILVAAINIFFSLSMLAIEKKGDIKILFAMGATPRLVRTIFLAEGALVAFTGAFLGLLLGAILCWGQAEFGWVKMGVVSVIDAYPVKMQWTDFAATAAIVVFITMIISYLPADRAAKTAA